MAVSHRAGKPGQGRLGGRVAKFLREVRAEMRKVNWPNRKELSTYTGVVIVSVLVAGLFMGLVDLVVSELLSLIGRLAGSS